jgi:hypothetical protein
LRPLVDITEGNAESGGAESGNCADGEAVGSVQFSAGRAEPVNGE